jgi:hypothetical protein
MFARLVPFYIQQGSMSPRQAVQDVQIFSGKMEERERLMGEVIEILMFSGGGVGGRGGVG